MFERFVVALKNDGRSQRDISLSLGFGPNYVQQVVKNGKMPSAARFSKMVEALGGPSSIYVYTGREITDADFRMLDAVTRLSPESRERAYQFFLSLVGDHDEAAQLEAAADNP